MHMLISTLCLASLGFVIAATKEDVADMFRGIALECLKEFPVPDGAIEKLLKEHVMPEDHDVRCMAACVYKTLGIMDEQGMIASKGAESVAEKLLSTEPKKLESVKKFIELCSKVNEETVSDGVEGCDRAALAYDCTYAHAHEFDIDLNK